VSNRNRTRACGAQATGHRESTGGERAQVLHTYNECELHPLLPLSEILFLRLI